MSSNLIFRFFSYQTASINEELSHTAEYPRAGRIIDSFLGETQFRLRRRNLSGVKNEREMLQDPVRDREVKNVEEMDGRAPDRRIRESNPENREVTRKALAQLEDNGTVKWVDMRPEAGNVTLAQKWRRYSSS